jgi:transposase-like protein
MSDPKLTIPGLGRMSEDDARCYFERLRWPNGPVCPRCGVVNDAALIESAPETENKVRAGLYYCRSCREPFTVTVGTVLEGSHIPISKWLMGFYLMASSKKGVSALQLQRQLGLGSYKTAWHMSHRIRHAMQNDPFPGKLSGHVEMDETYVGGKPRPGTPRFKKERGRGTSKAKVAVLVQRDGAARARVVANVDGRTLKDNVRENVERSATLYSDEWAAYTGLGDEFAGGHHVVRHGRGEYARPGGVHSNSAESYFSLLKRGVIGQFHHVSKEHLGRYLDEFSFRWTHKDVTDTERTRAALTRTTGTRLYYKKPRGEEGSGEGLVVGRSAS